MPKRSWKELGYVPDSEDEEEDDDDFRKPSSILQTENIPQTEVLDLSPISPLSSLSDVNYQKFLDELRSDFFTTVAHNEPPLLDIPRVNIARNFRQRTALQQHPYTLEGELYRNQLKSSGLRPIKIVSASDRVPSTLPSQDGDDTFFPESLSNPLDYARRFSDECSVPPSGISTQASALQSQDEELKQEVSPPASKRRRILSLSPTKISSLSPSPIAVSRLQSAPSGLSQIPHQEHAVAESNSSDFSDSSEASNEGTADVFARRLNGVLPRSWITLDMEAQKKRNDKQYKVAMRISHLKRATLPGTARKVSSTTRNNSLTIQESASKWLSADDSNDDSDDSLDSKPKYDEKTSHTPVIDLTRSGSVSSLSSSSFSTNSAGESENHKADQPLEYLSDAAHIRRQRKLTIHNTGSKNDCLPLTKPTPYHLYPKAFSRGIQTTATSRISNARNLHDFAGFDQSDRSHQKGQAAQFSVRNRTSTTQNPTTSTSLPRTYALPNPKAREAARPFRTAQLETLETVFGRQNKRTALHTTLRNAEKEFVLHKQDPRLGLPLARYLGEDKVLKSSGPNNQTMATAKSTFKKSRRRPKRIAHCAPNQEMSYERDNTEISVSYPAADSTFPRGLKKLSSIFSTDFGVIPLPKAYFISTSFIGSGQFYRAISMSHRPLNISNGTAKLTINMQHYCWSAWNESMSSELKSLFTQYRAVLESIVEAELSPEPMQSMMGALVRIGIELRRIIAVFAENLYFDDSIDRHTFPICMSENYKILILAMQNLCASASKPKVNDMAKSMLHMSVFLMTGVAQLAAIEGDDLSDQILYLLHNSAHVCTQLLLRAGFEDIGKSLQRIANKTEREAGLGKDDVSLEALVILNIILKKHVKLKLSIWNVFNDHMMKTGITNQIEHLEVCWKVIFSILPVLEFDANGAVKIGHRFESRADNWLAVASLLTDAFRLAGFATESTKGLNAYIRTLLKRCYKLVEGWAWNSCSSVLITWFTYFAMRKFEPLPDEDNFGPPSFLKLLDRDLTCEPEENDASFTLFLKLTALGLSALSSFLSPKSYSSLIMRLLPNHRRQYFKENDLPKIDLESLRNNHDLLCTLFWRSGEDLRPLILQSVRGLVDHSLSHQSACQLSIKAWTSLARQQLSHEVLPRLLPSFAEWMKHAIESAISHYKLAKSEASKYHERNVDKSTSMYIEDFVRQNRKSVRVLFGDAVHAIKAVLKISRSQRQSINLVRDSGVLQLLSGNLLDSYDDISILTSVFEMIQVYLDLPPDRIRELSQNDEESQETEDFPLEAFSMIADEAADEVRSIVFLENSVQGFLSTRLGQDELIFDAAVKTAIESWVKILNLRVRRGSIKWADVLHSSGRNSWESFLDSEVKRKFSAYFYSAVIAVDNRCFYEYEYKFMSVWLCSLVERKSKLKYQDILTNTLLNLKPLPELAFNLPFVKGADGTYCVSLKQLDDGRLSVISCVLSNMQTLRNVWKQYPSKTSTNAVDLSMLIREMMATIKRNYLELRPSERSGDNYVGFVHQIVGFLHQYTEEMYTVDSFFFEKFPLPANDSGYVTAKLKAYGGKMEDESRIRRLGFFLWNLCERSVLSGETKQLIKQITEALKSERQLRQVMIGTIFTGYVEVAFTTEAGWIMCDIVLEVMKSVVSNLVQTLDWSQRETFVAADEILHMIVGTFHKAVMAIHDDMALLKENHVLKELAQMMRIMTESLSCLDYVQQTRRVVSGACQSIHFFKKFSLDCAKYVLGIEEGQEIGLAEKIFPAALPSKHPGIEVALGNMVKANVQNFKVEAGNYYYNVNGRRLEAIGIDLLTYEQEAQMFVTEVEDFLDVIDRIRTL